MVYIVRVCVVFALVASAPLVQNVAMPNADPIIIGHPDRTTTLRRLQLLDTPAESSFDRLTRLATALLDAPISLLSLIDVDRQYHKSCTGQLGKLSGQTSITIAESFCQHVVASGQPLVVEDTRLDPLLDDNATTHSGALAYAGAPLTLKNGHVIGALCVLDGVPRQWTEQEVEHLHDLAAIAIREIELRDWMVVLAAEQALRERGERYCTLVKHLPNISVMLFDHSLSYIIAEGRTIIEQIFDEPSVEGRTLFQVLGSEQSQFLEPYYRAALAGTSQTLEYTHNAHTYVMQYVPIVNDRGQIEAGMVVTQDITNLKQAEHSLRQSQILLRNMIDAIPAAICAVDSEGRFTLLNKQYAEQYGIAHPRLAIGQPFEGFFPPELNAVFHAENAHIFATGESLRFEPTQIRDDHTITRMAVKFPLFSFEGAITGLGFIATDITERKQLEEALQRREELYRILVQNLPDTTVFLFDRDYRYLLAEGARFAEPGYDKTDVEGKFVVDVLPPDHYAPLIPYYHATMAGENGMLEIYANDRIFSTTFVPVRNEYDQVIAGMVVSQDITQRKRIEAALRTSEARYRAFVAASPDLKFQISRDGVYLDLEVPANAYLPAPYDQIIGRRVAALMPPDVTEQLMSAIQQAIDTETIQQVEYQLMSPGGREHYEARIVADGIDQVFATIRSLTAEKRIAEEYERVFNAATDMLSISNFLGYLERVNPAWERILGYTQAELLAKPFYAFIHPDDVARTYRAIERLQAGEPMITLENRYICKDGTVKWIQWRATLYEDETAYCYASGRDVTLQKQAELELQRANTELAQAARMKDAFLAGVSHELRTPLNAILGLSEAMQEYVYGPLNERQTVTLQNIAESGHHLLALINDILDLSRIEAGKVTLEFADVSLETVCNASLRLIKQTATQKRLRISCTLDSHVTTVHADERRLKQILINLLSNAIKFTPEHGSIGLEVYADVERREVALTVWDTGIGIAPADQARLFQPFVQLDNSLSRQYNGSGLGLVLVARMVELHGGSVSVTSQLGSGSRFTVRLPWTPEEPAYQPQPWASENTVALPAATENDGQNNHPHHYADLGLILLVDDNPNNTTPLIDYLSRQNYRVVIARSGQEAIAQAQALHPDIILMDIQMPGMDGLTAIQHIRADATMPAVPIIALTALAMAGDRERCLAAGATEYVSKPVGLKLLAALIASYLKTSREHTYE